MYIHVLGSAAGGGFPQWNCNCDNCHGLRQGMLKATARTQSSIAISDDGEQWILCNASPDIRQQFEQFSALQPARAKRDTALAGIILMDSQIDHVTGLLTLREGCPHQVWCTPQVHQDLSQGFPVFNILSHWNGGLEYQPIALDFTPFSIPGCPQLQITAVPILSNAPPYSPRRNNPDRGDNIALFIEDLRSQRSLFYAPGLGQVDDYVASWMQRADCLMVDGTVFHDNEMQLAGVGDKLGSEMGHLAQSGEHGMLQALSAYPEARKILIHINNTNPILNEDSPERALVEAANVEVAFDGMHFEV